MTFFSVIIPTFNRAHLISETIETVMAQTHSSFEIIVVDDGSSDATRQLFENRYATDSRIRYFYKVNEERGAARNYGLNMANGDYAVFFDSDDWMHPEYLSILNDTIGNNPGIFLLAAKYDYSNKGRKESHPVLRQLKEGWYERSLLLKGNFLACNFCIRIKEKNYKPFPPQRELASMEDWVFLLHNMENEKIYIKDKIGVTMRQHDERSMMNNQKVIEARMKATGWLLNNLQLDNSEKNILTAWSQYFCGIHQYLDRNRIAAMKNALAAIKGAGPDKKFLVLLAKSLIGHKIITAFR
jgi:GalNAc5-diNAcBac-PP-undecaprenol beta-1,3-glucosyltransferase